MQNILLIMMDQLRADTLGFAGDFPVRTPNIDRLAARGTVFQNAYTANPVCVPARASLMTGLHSFEHGVYYNDQSWPEAFKTYVERLTENCYDTVVVGKNHFRPDRRAAGFRKQVLTEVHTADLERRGLLRPTRKLKVGDGKSLNDPTWYPTEPTHLSTEDYTTVYMTNRALRELDRVISDRECGEGEVEPFFFKLSYLQPHSPCCPPEPYFSLYKPEDLPPPVRDEKEIDRFPKQLKAWYDIWKELEDDRAQKHRAQYLGDITLLDEQIGRVLDRLDERGILDNTLVVLTSDHGDYLGDHFLQQKAFFHDCSARVPFIFAGPGVPSGKVIRENVSHVDLYPTLMEYCKLAMPPLRDENGKLIYADARECEAISLLPYFQEEGPVRPDRVVISENAIQGRHFMLKQGDLKVNYYVNQGGDNEFEVYDMASDPNELDNRGSAFSLADLSPGMREAFDRVMEKSERHAGGHYFFQGKVRPMFS